MELLWWYVARLALWWGLPCCLIIDSIGIRLGYSLVRSLLMPAFATGYATFYLWSPMMAKYFYIGSPYPSLWPVSSPPTLIANKFLSIQTNYSTGHISSQYFWSNFMYFLTFYFASTFGLFYVIRLNLKEWGMPSTLVSLLFIVLPLFWLLTYSKQWSIMKKQRRDRIIHLLLIGGLWRKRMRGSWHTCQSITTRLFLVAFIWFLEFSISLSYSISYVHCQDREPVGHSIEEYASAT